MAQIFEVTWSEGTVTPELISSLLRQYVTQGGLYGTIVVKEAAQQSVQPTIESGRELPAEVVKVESVLPAKSG